MDLKTVIVRKKADQAMKRELPKKVRRRIFIELIFLALLQRFV
jgi:hypothetical protein